MNARAEAIMRLGGACAWCGCDDPTQLEIDHIDGGHGQGNAHRRNMTARGTTIAYELRRLGYPPGYRLLCGCCHDIRSYGKVVTMPPRRGHKDVHVSLPDALVDELERLAKKRGDGSKSNVIVDLLAGHGTGQTVALMAKVHERLDTLEATLASLTAQINRLAQVPGDVTDLKRELSTQKGDIQAIYDAVQRIEEASKKRWFG
jgi:hypothetical protein